MKIFTVLSIILIISSTNAQEIKKIQPGELMPECAKSEYVNMQNKTVVWFPLEFMEIFITQLKLSQNDLDKIMNMLNEHMIFLVVDSKIDVVQQRSVTTFKTDAQIRKNIKLIDSSNKSFSPISEDELSNDMTDFLNGMKPSLAKLLGEMGKGMNVYIFKNKLINGESSFNIRTKNKFSINFDSSKFTWNLPFVCTLPDLFCPIDKEKMKGNWNYCPTHGTSLAK
ncbi:MAG: hypothetical protein HYZ54_02430 [Ignavibacteriae bacterium]|nr:hypothetical protein [Ignavibacteriota bacterium]